MGLCCHRSHCLLPTFPSQPTACRIRGQFIYVPWNLLYDWQDLTATQVKWAVGVRVLRGLPAGDALETCITAPCAQTISKGLNTHSIMQLSVTLTPSPGLPGASWPWPPLRGLEGCTYNNSRTLTGYPQRSPVHLGTRGYPSSSVTSNKV